MVGTADTAVRPAVDDVDVVVVGAGFAGMYLVVRCRAAGLSVVVYEAGTDVGGTWYWNRYPGARCDVVSMEYSYSFSPELEQEWAWTEAMAAQPEILRYAQHVADRFELRSAIRFSTRVTEATFDERAARWVVRTDRGDTTTARHCVMATGCLSAANLPDIAGRDTFAGRLLHTGNWPKDPVDLSGRVGIIGTGSSGVQAIPVVAEQAAHLTVFQRTPTFTFPANNRPMKPEIQAAYKEHYREVREAQKWSAAGMSGFSPSRGTTILERRARRDGAPSEPRLLAALDAEGRRAAWDRLGFGIFTYFTDVYRDPVANEYACELYREHIRTVVGDPTKAQALSPVGYPVGCKRQVLDTNFYETFNRPNVDVVDIGTEPIERITPDGVRTTARQVDLDTLVFATGFDAMTGALDRIDIVGRSGELLRDHWADGPRTYLGLQVAGFPNLFTVTGPGSPSVLSNVIVAIEQHVEWIVDTIVDLGDRGVRTIETTVDAEARWGAHVNEVAEGTMYTAPTCSSWYLGANIEGKPRQFLPYVGGFARYRATCDQVRADGYDGFVLS